LSGKLIDEILENYKDYRLVDGLLYYRGRLCAPNVREIQESILRNFHDIPVVENAKEPRWREFDVQDYYNLLKCMR